MFERVWNRDAVDHVEITVAETVGIEGRGAYCEEAGALRDMVQNHLLQLLSFLAMEPPRSLEPEAIRDEKVKMLRALRPLDPAEVVRGQYVRGRVGGVEVPGYRDEEGVAPGSTVETYVALRAWIDDWRWDGVPFVLPTGKGMPARVTQATVVFREPPGYLFEGLGLGVPPPNFLCLRIQPDEGISFCFQAKERGRGSGRGRWGWTSHTGPRSRRRRPTPTSACSTTRCAAIGLCSSGRTGWSGPGRPWTPSWRPRPRSGATRPAPGDRRRPTG
jgi:glucose-6-phosphate 1-dehydrogenase